MESRDGFLLRSSIQTILQKCQSALLSGLWQLRRHNPWTLSSFGLTALILSIDQVSSNALERQWAALRSRELAETLKASIVPGFMVHGFPAFFVARKRSRCLLTESLARYFRIQVVGGMHYVAVGPHAQVQRPSSRSRSGLFPDDFRQGPRQGQIEEESTRGRSSTTSP